MCKNCDDCYWRSEVNEDYCFATQNKITNEGCDNYKSSSDMCDDMKNKWERYKRERFDMKENKELKDLLTTGTIVEIHSNLEEEYKCFGVVMGDVILYDIGFDLVDSMIKSTESKNNHYYISKIYSPNKKCHKLKDLLDNSNSDIIWERNNKPNRLTREEFAKLPLGTKIIGVNEDKNMEELEFMKIKDYFDYFLDNAVLCLSDYKTYEFFGIDSVAYYLKEEYEEYKKRIDK